MQDNKIKTSYKNVLNINDINKALPIWPSLYSRPGFARLSNLSYGLLFLWTASFNF